MNNTTEQIQQERIDVLNETIDIMNRIIKTNEEHKQHLNQTIIEEVKRYDNAIQPLEAKNEQLIKRINILKQTIEINNKTIEMQRHDNNLLLQHANNKTNE